MTGRKLTPKQEKFCLKYVETGNASEAYRQSYDAENMKADVITVKACELLKGGNVAVRVKELQDELRETYSVTVESLAKELDEARSLANMKEMPAPMIQASMGKARLYGLDVARHEHTGKDGKDLIPELSDVERAQRIAFLLDGAGRSKTKES